MKGHIRPRGKGFALIVPVGKYPNGKTRYKWHKFEGSKRAAQIKLSNMIAEISKGEYVEPSKVTVESFLKDWLASIRSSVTPKTLERYSELVNGTIVPGIGHHKLTDLRPIHISTLYSDLREKGRKDGKGGLSARTVLHVHRVLKGALKQARGWRMIAINPCDDVKAPKAERAQIVVLEKAQCAMLMGRLAGTKMYAPAGLALATGLRRGEVLALRWKDIDLDTGALHVRRSLEQTKDKGLRYKNTKTDRGRRTIALPAYAIDVLKAHKKEQAEYRLKLGPLFVNEGLVFPGPMGGPQPPRSFSARFAEIVATLDIPAVTFHGLRHTHVSHLIAQKVDIKAISDRIGHSSVAFTLDVYGHLLSGAQEDVARIFDAAMRDIMG